MRLQDITDLFPWSSQARVINYMISCHEADLWFHVSNISEGSKVHPRNVPKVMIQLLDLGIVLDKQSTKYSSRRVYILNSHSTIGVTLMKLYLEMAKR